MAYDLTGKVKLILEPQTFVSGFTKREIVVTVEDGKFPQDISLEFLQDKVSLLDSVSEGQGITVFFDIRGREYNGRYFNNLVGWKIEGAGDAAAPDLKKAAPVPQKAFVPKPAVNGKPDLGSLPKWDDLEEPPF